MCRLEPSYSKQGQGRGGSWRQARSAQLISGQAAVTLQHPSRGTGGDELHLQESCRRLMFLSFVVQNEMFGEKCNHSKAKRSSRPTTNGGRASQGVGSSKESRTSSGGRAS